MWRGYHMATMSPTLVPRLLCCVIIGNVPTFPTVPASTPVGLPLSFCLSCRSPSGSTSYPLLVLCIYMPCSIKSKSKLDAQSTTKTPFLKHVSALGPSSVLGFRHPHPAPARYPFSACFGLVPHTPPSVFVKTEAQRGEERGGSTDIIVVEDGTGNQVRLCSHVSISVCLYLLDLCPVFDFSHSRHIIGSRSLANNTMSLLTDELSATNPAPNALAQQFNASSLLFLHPLAIKPPFLRPTALPKMIQRTSLRTRTKVANDILRE